MSNETTLKNNQTNVIKEITKILEGPNCPRAEKWGLRRGPKFKKTHFEPLRGLLGVLGGPRRPPGSPLGVPWGLLGVSFEVLWGVNVVHIGLAGFRLRITIY